MIYFEVDWSMCVFCINYIVSGISCKWDGYDCSKINCY